MSIFGPFLEYTYVYARHGRVEARPERLKLAYLIN